MPSKASKIEAIDWYSFLARPRLPSPSVESLDRLRDTSILVTGAGGSIGSALSLQLAALRPRKLILLDASEQALHRLQFALAQDSSNAQIITTLANVTDRAYLEEIFATHRPQLVYHAAAYKHVPLLEEHPLQAIVNNALGTFTLNECAANIGVERIVLLSTDKAVAPLSILGATKRIAEQITLAHRGVVLRLGNVLGTDGSVCETFFRQISSGAPLTVAANAERYFLTCEETVDLLITAATIAPSGSLVVPRLDRQHSIVSLAEFLIATLLPEAIPAIEYTGLRPGDKLCEALWSLDEQPFSATREGYFELKQPALDRRVLHRELKQLEETTRQRDLLRMLEIVQQLVPDYHPSTTVLKTLENLAQGVTQR